MSCNAIIFYIDKSFFSFLYFSLFSPSLSCTLQPVWNAVTKHDFNPRIRSSIYRQFNAVKRALRVETCRKPPRTTPQRVRVVTPSEPLRGEKTLLTHLLWHTFRGIQTCKNFLIAKEERYLIAWVDAFKAHYVCDCSFILC